MAVVVDACVARFALCESVRFVVLKEWFRKSRTARIAVCRELLDEYRAVGVVWSAYRTLDRVGRVVEASEESVAAERISVAGIGYKSDDPHIIALLRSTSVRVVCTDDANLVADVKDLRLLRPKRKVYPEGDSAAARRLLREYGHCGDCSD